MTNVTTRTATLPLTTTTTTTSPPYVCSRDADFADWAEQRRDWCCKHFTVGCPGANPYNCVSGYALWKVQWSMPKKIWCCQHANRGCLPSTSTTGLGNWKFGWSAEKEAWCCQAKKVGCREGPRPTLPAAGPWKPFNCSEDFATWRTTWSHPKRQWCCGNFQKACEGTTQEPYDCTAGYKNWQTGWSQQKREWCCKSYNRGCTDVLKEYELEPWQIRGHHGHPAVTSLTVGTAALGASLLMAVVAFRPARGLWSPSYRAGLAYLY